MSKTPVLKVAVANKAPLARNLTATEVGADPVGLTVAERLLSLHERLLVGDPVLNPLLQRFLGWAEAQGMGEGLVYSAVDDGTDAPLTLGVQRHHSITYQLVLESAALGTLTLMRRERFSEAELLVMERALTCLCHHLKLALELQSYQRQALHDGLTGLLNRTSLDDRLAQELNKTQRHGGTLSLMLIDVDHFKDLNDRLGHLSGDHALKSLADIFRSETRESDLSFRYGGDEFAILLPATDLCAAQCTAERIGRKLRAAPIETFYLDDGNTPLRPELSIGVAEYLPGDTEADLLQRADTHLYHAKARGRGRTCAQV